MCVWSVSVWRWFTYTATHCNTLQHTATHCNTLQHTAAHCNTLQHTTTHCNTLQHDFGCRVFQSDIEIHTLTHALSLFSLYPHPCLSVSLSLAIGNIRADKISKQKTAASVSLSLEHVVDRDQGGREREWKKEQTQTSVATLIIPQPLWCEVWEWQKKQTRTSVATRERERKKERKRTSVASLRIIPQPQPRSHLSML